MKRNINEGCDGCVKNIRSSSATSSEEILDNTKLNIVLTNKGLQIYGTWSKTKLLNLLTHKLKQCVHSQLKSQHLNTKTINEKRLWITIHSGLYSISVLRTLQEKSMSIHTIIKAMKLGLISLNPCELSYFKCFNVDPYILELKDMWTSKFNNVLISNLRAIGLSEPDSWRIIVYGVGLQSSCILCYLLLSGIDIPGIVNWQSPTNHASHKILKFLEHIGIEEDVIQLVEKYGIDEETEQMLIDIGLDQIEEIYSHEIICECSLNVLEPITCNSEIAQSMTKISEPKSNSTLSVTPNYSQHACQCHLAAGKNTIGELTAQRNDYLRQNVMVPLAWVLARTLKYKPSDPLHYMIYQLLHWKHNSVNQPKKESIKEVIALATVAMDQKLIQRKFLEKEKLIEHQNEEAMKNIPCTGCREHQNLRRIKERCWKCIKRPVKKYSICEFPETCSACKISVPAEHVCEFPQFCSSCRIDERSLKKFEACDLPQFCSSCKIDEGSLKKFEACDLPQFCSSCKIDGRLSKTFLPCNLPQFCSFRKIGEKPLEKFEDCDHPQFCSSCKIDEGSLKKFEACNLPQMCSSCKVDVSNENDNVSLILGRTSK